MELLLTMILLGVVVAVIADPLRRRGTSGADEPSRRRAAELAKDAKYREILDAELDFRTGKLSEPDYRAIDRQLRGEASELLRRLDVEETETGRR
jgi:hypothetical protein